MRIGKVDLKSRVFLARSTGSNPIAFRLLCKKYGAGSVMSKNFYAEEVIKNGVDLSLYQGVEPLFVELCGKDPENTAKAAKIIDENPHGQIIALNFADSRPKLIEKKLGSYMLQYPKKIADIVKKVKENVKKPVVIVMRIGYKDNNAAEVAKAVKDAGADGIIFHARRGIDEHTDPVNWRVVKEVKELVNIPVILRGSVDSPEAVKKAISETKADGAMIGREAVGNPYIFLQTNQYLVTGVKTPNPNLKRRKEIYLEFLDLYKKVGQNVPFEKFRNLTIEFFRGVSDEKIILAEMQKVKSQEDLILHVKGL